MTTNTTNPKPDMLYRIGIAAELGCLRDDMDNARRAYHQRIAQANAAGLSTRTIARMVGVSHQTIHNIVKNQRTTTR